MTRITWGRVRPYNGTGECPEIAKDVACAVIYKPPMNQWFGASGFGTGRNWPNWKNATAYRIPAWMDASD